MPAHLGPLFQYLYGDFYVVVFALGNLLTEVPHNNEGLLNTENIRLEVIIESP